MFPNSGLLETDEPGRWRLEVNPLNTWLAHTGEGLSKVLEGQMKTADELVW